MDFVRTLLFLCVLSITNGSDETKRPNIIFFLTDDWGFNDIGYNENTDTQTPFISQLARDNSLIISQYYAMPLCSVTRCALLTGRYPMRYGLQSEVIFQTSNYALSRYETLISSEFKAQGYSTHLIGKWHLGYLGWDYTPTFRGFDTFFGFYGGVLDYFEHTSSEADITNAKDFHSQTEPYDEADRYSLYMYSNEIVSKLDEIKEKDNEDPFFMYVGWQGSHIPSEAPYEYLEMYSSVLSDADSSNSQMKGFSSDTLSKRTNFQAQTTLTDELFKNIVGKLVKDDLWDNTLLIFASDNGADPGSGDNSPLRGGKGTLFEGGVRVPAFVTGGYLPQKLRGKVFNSSAMSAVDWYPTLLEAAGLDIKVSKNTLDGINLWRLMQEQEQEQEKETQFDSLNINNNEKKRKKLRLEKEILSDWEINEFMGSQGNDNINDNILDLDGSNSDFDSKKFEFLERIILLNVDSENCENEACGALIYGSKWKLMINYAKYSDWVRDYAVSEYNEDTGMAADALKCGTVPNEARMDTTKCESNVCLFDLEKDPCEYYDVSEGNSILANNLYKVLIWYYERQVPPLYSNIGYVEDESILITNVDIDENGFIINQDSNIDKNNDNDKIISQLYWTPYWPVGTWKSLDFELYLKDYYMESEREMSEKKASLKVENNNYKNINRNSFELNKKNNEIIDSNEVSEVAKSNINIWQRFGLDSKQSVIALVFFGVLVATVSIFCCLRCLQHNGVCMEKVEMRNNEFKKLKDDNYENDNNIFEDACEVDCECECESEYEVEVNETNALIFEKKERNLYSVTL